MHVYRGAVILPRTAQKARMACSSEALARAIKAEQAASELYTGLAEATDEPNLAAIFTALASEEERHKHRFEVEYDEVVLEGV